MLPLEHSAILLTFIKLPFVIKIFVLSIFEWPFYTCFTVFVNIPLLSDHFKLQIGENKSIKLLKNIYSRHNKCFLSNLFILKLHKKLQV